VHEFLSVQAEDAAATSGFVSGLISSMMKAKGTGMWISSSRSVFPPALKMLGIPPERFVFLDLKNERDVLWATDEALKCGALTAVVSELKHIDFTQSRRLQLAVEQSQSTCFLLRQHVRNPGTTACVSRWKVSSLPSSVPDDLPGIGYPGWKIELLRIRNGVPGSWNVQWINGAFVSLDSNPVVTERKQKMLG